MKTGGIFLFGRTVPVRRGKEREIGLDFFPKVNYNEDAEKGRGPLSGRRASRPPVSFPGRCSRFGNRILRPK